MRGGSQAHLIEADDGGFYVVKFSNNPQGRRVLVNDAIGSVLLRYLGVSTPEPVLVTIVPEFLQQNPEVSLQLCRGRVPVEPGAHFGSRYPGHPDRLAVFDLLPDLLLPSVENAGEFLGALVFDKWAANTDRRQAVFFRRECSEPRPARWVPFHALMIDHGSIFGGSCWDLAIGPLHGLYTSRRVYEAVRSLLDFEPWLEKVAHLSEAAIEQLPRGMPGEWMDGDSQELEHLLEALVRRRRRVAELLLDCWRAKPSVFPNWRRTRAKPSGRVSRTPPAATAV
jgi:hypothetical protein